MKKYTSKELTEMSVEKFKKLSEELSEEYRQKQYSSNENCLKCGYHFEEHICSTREKFEILVPLKREKIDKSLKKCGAEVVRVCLAYNEGFNNCIDIILEKIKKEYEK